MVLRVDGSPFIVHGRKPKIYRQGKEPKNAVYRCDRDHRALSAWLRRLGINDDKPCHRLRKEFGSYVATSFGFYKAPKLFAAFAATSQPPVRTPSAPGTLWPTFSAALRSSRPSTPRSPSAPLLSTPISSPPTHSLACRNLVHPVNPVRKQPE